MKEYNIIIEEELLYVGEIEDNIIKLRFSKSDIWQGSTQGEEIGELKDSGNGIKIKCHGKKLKLDYDEFIELYQLMKLKIETDKNL